MALDLYTDASIVKGRGAWAALVVIDAAPVAEYSGPLRGSFRSSAATEIAAIGNGLWHARKAGLIMAGAAVTVWCDNMAAVLWANGQARECGNPKPSTDPRLMECRRFIRDYSRQHGFKVRACHIKGHQRLDSADPRAVFNIRCDQLCGAVRDGRQADAFTVLAAKVVKARARKAAGQGSRKERELWAAEGAVA